MGKPRGRGREPGVPRSAAKRRRARPPSGTLIDAVQKKKKKRLTVGERLAAVVQMSRPRGRAEPRRPSVSRGPTRGARLVGLPENFGFLRSEGQPVRRRSPSTGPGCAGWRSWRAATARSCSAACRNASPATRACTTRRCSRPRGRDLAVYRKIHLFDIDVPGIEHLKESSASPGREIVDRRDAGGPLGLSICYDVRFPELYRGSPAAARGCSRARGLHGAHGQGALGTAAASARGREPRLRLRPGAVRPARRWTRLARAGDDRRPLGLSRPGARWRGRRPRRAGLRRLERLRRELPALSHARLLDRQEVNLTRTPGTAGARHVD